MSHSERCVTWRVMSCVTFQIPRYIITLHELLAHTPHEHVERKSLEFAKSKLEELSKWAARAHSGRCVVTGGRPWPMLMAIGLRCQDDARWGERHGEHQKEPGHREDDRRGLWHPVRHESDLRQTRWAASASSASWSLWQSWRLTLTLDCDSRGQALSSSCRPAASEACSVRSAWAPSPWGRKESDSVFCLPNTFSSVPEHLEESFTCSRSAAEVRRHYPNTVEGIT